MNTEAVKVAAHAPEVYHVNNQGERVTPETCECYQCAMQRAMQTQLDAIDRAYLQSEAVQVLDRERVARAARLRSERRQRVIDTFIKVGFVGCTMPMVIKVPMKIDIEQIEVARDAWQEDEGKSERWRSCLKEHPLAVQNYLAKRFAKERADLEGMPETSFASNQRFRITSLTYVQNALEQWEVTDNTPGE